MAAGSDFLTVADTNLRDFGMRVSRRVELPDGPVADLFGSRTYFSWKGFVILSQHVAVCDYGDRTATPADAQALFAAAFRRAKKVNRVPLLRGMQFGYMVIPCLIVQSADDALVEYAESRPRKHWSLFEFPVVVDRSSGRTHCYTETAMWGAFFFSDMRALVRRCIVPAIKRAEPGAAPDTAG
ncbi:hypothetical protein R5W24_004707 [Gemmata sp. JC717]|uniref:hypothetical protein n=1 Tax=Gemmata algarum TaxID=2975278 RepID=UPI0021BAA783|nr:hypothetical protein [Gemmata algarum]MDY3555564.1 hypothetical protein [Gemmata algarum]